MKNERRIEVVKVQANNPPNMNALVQFFAEKIERDEVMKNDKRAVR